MKKRRDFLKEVCPTVAFAFFGISFLEACSSGSSASDDDVDSKTLSNRSWCIHKCLSSCRGK